MPISNFKPILLITTLFIGGYLSGLFWHYLGDKHNIINSYLEVHNSRFINTEDSNQIFYVIYKDFNALSNYIGLRTDFHGTQLTSIDQVATVNIEKSSLPDSLNLLREKDFIRFVIPGTFPFICH